MFLLLHTNLPVTPPKRDKNEPKNDFFLPDLGGLTIIVKAIKFSSESEQKYDTKQENLLKSVKSGHFEVSPVKSGRFWKKVGLVVCFAVQSSHNQQCSTVARGSDFGRRSYFSSTFSVLRHPVSSLTAVLDTTI